MSSLPFIPQLERPATARKPARILRPARGVWSWAIPAIILLSLSAGVRVWQDIRFAEEIALNKVVPFSLKKIPSKIGNWSVLENSETFLDPRIIQIAGASDYVLRTYINRENGVSVTALVLSGPAESVVAHVPEACYPANGYRQLGFPLDKHIEFDKKNARQAWFRSLVYAKGGSLGLPPFAEEVYYSFQFKGNWNPFPGSATRITRRSPWVIKIQVQRRVGVTEDRDIDNPTQAFLAKLVPEVESLLKESGVKTSVDQAASAARPATVLAAGS